ncbi:hypothetical protein EV174_004024 [Coemansia sp. RSA 2320]|nr:hypothetical protein EV174_004024 [Coemansia sp. RSA 2320]
MLVNCRGNQVPYPQNPQFRSDSCAYKMSFGFWTPFQQEMWSYFLDVHTGPCFLDAAFDLQKDGFQLWTLFFELGNLTVPISFMVTTSLTMKLLYDWLSEIASFRPKVPKKTIYVNTMKAHELIGPILPDWDVRYAKYYIAQELRELVLRSDCAEPYDASVISSVQSINSNFLSSFKALLPVSAILTKMNYIFSMVSEWLPKTTAEMALFDHSADAISRWRYQLWMTMLGRPSNQRVDTVLYYLHSVFIPGVEKSFRERKDQNASPIPFNMDGMEHGSSPLHKSVCELRTKPLGGSLVCLSEDRELAQKVIVDLDLQVCFCEKFMQSKTCPHLVFCMPSAIHHPMLPRLLHDIPRA